MRNLIIFGFLFISIILDAQTKKITGKITFQDEPVPETFITIKAADVYNATSNEDGVFIIEIPQEIIEFTITWEHLQFKPQSLNINKTDDFKLDLKFTEENNQQLEKIVITQENKNIRRFDRL